MRIRRKLIRQKVAELLQNASVAAPPVPVDRIAKQLSLEVRLAPDQEGMSGFLFTDPVTGKVVIGVNNGHHPNRRRFTIAHEIGHFLLHGSEEVHVDKTTNFQITLRSERSGAGEEPVEIEANSFAAELLMPQHLMERDFAKKKQALDFGDDSVIQDLAKRYKVSVSAMIFRLANLGYVQL